MIMDYILVISGTTGLLLLFMAVAADMDMNETLFKTIVIIVIVVAVIIILNLLARDFNF